MTFQDIDGRLLTIAWKLSETAFSIIGRGAVVIINNEKSGFINNRFTDDFLNLTADEKAVLNNLSVRLCYYAPADFKKSHPDPKFQNAACLSSYDPSYEMVIAIDISANRKTMTLQFKTVTRLSKLDVPSGSSKTERQLYGQSAGDISGRNAND